jgi:hypothetical protein
MKPLAPTLLRLALLAAPLAGGAQERGKMPRVGVLVAEPAPHPCTEAFRSGLRDPGYVERPQHRDRVAVRRRIASHHV